MQFAFAFSNTLSAQFQAPVGQFMKKDFVPYSERKAREAEIDEQRAAARAAAPEGPGVSGDVPSGRELVDLLPL